MWNILASPLDLKIIHSTFGSLLHMMAFQGLVGLKAAAVHCLTNAL